MGREMTEYCLLAMDSFSKMPSLYTVASRQNNHDPAAHPLRLLCRKRPWTNQSRANLAVSFLHLFFTSSSWEFPGTAIWMGFCNDTLFLPCWKFYQVIALWSYIKESGNPLRPSLFSIISSSSYLRPLPHRAGHWPTVLFPTVRTLLFN